MPSGAELFAAIGIDFLHYPFVSLHFVVSFHSEINQQISLRHGCGTLENISKTINKSFVSIIARLSFQHIVRCVYSNLLHHANSIEAETHTHGILLNELMIDRVVHSCIHIDCICSAIHCTIRLYSLVVIRSQLQAIRSVHLLIVWHSEHSTFRFRKNFCLTDIRSAMFEFTLKQDGTGSVNLFDT